MNAKSPPSAQPPTSSPAPACTDSQAPHPTALRRQLADLTTFADYLTAVKFYAAADGQAEQLYSDPAAWAHITYGVIVAFREWMLQQGYAVGTVDLKLSTVRQYAKLWHFRRAHYINAGQHALIRTVSGYQFKEQKRVDEKRSADGRTTRKGAKKAESVTLDSQQVRALKTRPLRRPRGGVMPS